MKSSKTNSDTHPFEIFVYSVNKSGLPITQCLSSPVGTPAIQGLKAQEVAKIYWMLRSIKINYSYRINNQEFHRKHVLETPITPKERVYWTPVFSKSSSENHVDCFINLDLNHFVDLSQETYGLEWSLNESDHDFRYTLSTNLELDGKILDVFHFDFLGQPQTCTLYAFDSNTFGSIQDFNFSLDFFQNS